jgi:hypothetical protein
MKAKLSVLVKYLDTSQSNKLLLNNKCRKDYKHFKVILVLIKKKIKLIRVKKKLFRYQLLLLKVHRYHMVVLRRRKK